MPHLGEVQSTAARALALAGSGGGGGGASWGSITGTLSAQADLAAVLATIPKVGQIVVTVPALAYEHEQTVAAVGLTSAMKVIPSIAPHSDTDENHETLIDLAALAAEPGTDVLTVRMGFGTPTSGPIRINYTAA